MLKEPEESYSYHMVHEQDSLINTLSTGYLAYSALCTVIWILLCLSHLFHHEQKATHKNPRKTGPNPA